MLPFDEVAGEYYADDLVAREAAGTPVTADAQIAAICLAQDAKYAKWNTKALRTPALT
ncbi:hypothetical protein ACIOJF_16800 [Glutamicibacter sp. NPDC087831]|uniref:hypothetical protein n=1 Tax=Glutamicibacter sp. NPDC087831 TaxID=3363998 RepID=UPI0037FBA85B